MKNTFFTFVDPFLANIDEGNFFKKPMSWFYVLHAIIFLIIPIVTMVAAIKNNVFEYPFKFGFSFILIWLVLIIACWICFLIWWNRKNRVLDASTVGDEFTATPVFAHFIQTLGEVLGVFIAVAGFGFSLIAAIFLQSDAKILAQDMGMGFLGIGFGGILAFPILGFFIIIFSRVVGEGIRALASIANNTKKMEG